MYKGDADNGGMVHERTFTLKIDVKQRSVVTGRLFSGGEKKSVCIENQVVSYESERLNDYG